MEHFWAIFVLTSCILCVMNAESVGAEALLGSGNRAVLLLVELMGSMTLWSGLMELLSASGDVKRLGKILARAARPLFPGVREWFDRINAFGDSLGVTVEHYVLSSGLKEIIEGSGIAHQFKKIYACEFYYRDGVACWPKLDVNFTNKTQFVYRINKGVLDVSEDKKLNDSMPDDSKRVPFTNMIYVGDGLSDVPCMKMMRSYGGQAIAVYQESNRTGVEELLAKGRVDFIFPADYREGTALDLTVQNIIRKMAICDALAAENAAQMRGIGQFDLPYQETLF